MDEKQVLDVTAVNLWNPEKKAFDGLGAEFRFARIPHAGEYVLLTGEGDATDVVCHVVHVLHVPAGRGDVNAEIFAVSMENADELHQSPYER